MHSPFFLFEPIGSVTVRLYLVASYLASPFLTWSSGEEVLLLYSLIMYTVILLRSDHDVHNSAFTISYRNLKDVLLYFLIKS